MSKCGRRSPWNWNAHCVPALTAAPYRRQVRQVVALIVTVICCNLSIQLFSGSLPIYLARDRGFSI